MYGVRVVFVNILLLMLSVSQIHAKRKETDEYRLLQYLFQNYDNEVRPVFNLTDTVNVEFSLSLIQIVNVNSKSQLLSTSVWIRQHWNNPFLIWNPSEFGGIETINVDPSKVWIPDMILYNNADETYGGGRDKYKTKVILDHNGMNKWYSPASFTSTCMISVRMFPFDRQMCAMKFGSWTYGGDRLTMTSTSQYADTAKYIENGEWDLVEMKAGLNKMKYSCCPYDFYDVTFYLKIKRKPLYYVFNLIIPCALIATLTLIKFFLPPECGEKIGLGITVLLAMTVFLMIVAESLPSTSEHIPLLGQYFLAVMFDTALSLVASCIILNCFHRNPAMTPLPDWVRRFILGYLASLLFFDSSEWHKEAKKRRQNRHRNENAVFNSEHFANGFIDLKPLNTNGQTATCNGGIHSNQKELSDPVSLKVLEGISVLANNVRHQEEDEFLRDEWRLTALVLDRAFFVLFLTTTLLTSGTLFLQAPVTDE